MEQLRLALLEYNKALHNNHEPMDDPYIYIIGHEIRVRGCLTSLTRRNFLASSISQHSTQGSFYTSDDDMARREPVQPQTGNGQPNPATPPMPFIPYPPAPPGQG
jgi:hypothetical protein